MNSGYLPFNCRLLSAGCPVKEALERHFKFECVVGMNGRVWINSGHISTTIAIVNALLYSEFMSKDQCSAMVENVVKRL